VTEKLSTKTEKEVAALFTDSTTIAVYNKGVLRVFDEEGIKIKKEASSVSRSITDLLKHTNGGILVNSAMSPEEKLIAETERLVKWDGNIWIKFITHPEKEFNEFYRSFTNPFLWLFHHCLLNKLSDSSKNRILNLYESYKRVNYRLAKDIQNLLGKCKNPRILLQDYHIYLMPQALRLLHNDFISTHFVHIPFPPAEYLVQNLPKVIAEEILCAMLENNAVGFHTKEYAKNFMQACEKLLGAQADYDKFVINYSGKTVNVQVNPISIDINEYRKNAKSPDILKMAQNLKVKFKGRTIIGNCERIDFTKGIIESLYAFKMLLEKYPLLKEKVAMCCFLDPYRLDSILYKKLQIEIENVAASINREFSPHIGWNGIFHSREEMNKHMEEEWPILVADMSPRKPAFALQLISDVALVNPLIDGMNLVAKEFAVLNDPPFIKKINQNLSETFGPEAVSIEPAVIVASKNMGASLEIDQGAIIIKPDNLQEITDAIYSVIIMSSEERSKRASLAALQVLQNTSKNWIQRLLEGIAQPI
jgi:trehalose 6-phosphate synthase